MRRLFDAHIHLDQYGDAERLKILESLDSSGIDGLVAVSMGMNSCIANRDMANRWLGRIMPAYGHHPEQSPLDESELDLLCNWIRERNAGNEPFAIGEVGLPYYTRKDAETSGNAFDQKPYLLQLERFVRLAAEWDKPIALHAVYEDADVVLDMLVRYSIRRAHFHWFKGSSAAIERIVRNGYMISVTPDLLYESEIKELAIRVPLRNLMVETDGPWTFEGPFAGKSTVPGMVRDVLIEIAKLRSVDVNAVQEVVRRNCISFYGWENYRLR